MTNSELRDTLAAGSGSIDGRADLAELGDNLRRRLDEAQTCLVRLREEADRRRWQEPRTDEQRALVKLLDDVGSPLAYLVGFVEASLTPGGP
jgi:hypothetical protein